MSEHRRLFFALTLPPELQQQIIDWRSAHFTGEAGRPIAAANLHLTLAFLGEVSPDKQQALSRLAGRIQQAPFSLSIDDAGQWLRSGIIWLGARQPPRGLLQLASLLRSQAARNGCYQSPLPFHPHITLYRQAVHAVPLPPPGFNWTIDIRHFSLFSSTFKQGKTQYRQLEQWPLIAHKEP